MIEEYKKEQKLSENVIFHYKEILILFPDLNIHHDKLFAYDHNSEDCYTQREVSTYSAYLVEEGSTKTLHTMIFRFLIHMELLQRKGISPSILLTWKPRRNLKEEIIFLHLITDLSMLYWSTLNIAKKMHLMTKSNWNKGVIKKNYKSSLIQTRVARRCIIFWSLKVHFFAIVNSTNSY